MPLELSNSRGILIWFGSIFQHFENCISDDFGMTSFRSAPAHELEMTCVSSDACQTLEFNLWF